MAQRLGYKIVEVPIPWYYFGNSKVRVLKDSAKMALDLLRIRISLNKRKLKPLK